MLIPVFIHIYIPNIHYTAPMLIHIMYSLLSLTLRLTSFDIFFSFRGGAAVVEMTFFTSIIVATNKLEPKASVLMMKTKPIYLQVALLRSFSSKQSIIC